MCSLAMVRPHELSEDHQTLLFWEASVSLGSIAIEFIWLKHQAAVGEAGGSWGAAEMPSSSHLIEWINRIPGQSVLSS